MPAHERDDLTTIGRCTFLAVPLVLVPAGRTGIIDRGRAGRQDQERSGQRAPRGAPAALARPSVPVPPPRRAHGAPDGVSLNARARRAASRSLPGRPGRDHQLAATCTPRGSLKPWIRRQLTSQAGID